MKVVLARQLRCLRQSRRRVDACMTPYFQSRKVEKRSTREWDENGRKTLPEELSRKGTLALRGAREAQVRLDLDQLKDCLARIR